MRVWGDRVCGGVGEARVDGVEAMSTRKRKRIEGSFIGGSGSLHPRWRGGVTLNDKGYLRYSSGSLRGRYVHRVVMAKMVAEMSYYPANAQSGLPPGFTVEHLDHCKTHNCPSNLLLLQIEIHNALSWRSWLNKPQIGDVLGNETLVRGPDDYTPIFPSCRTYSDDEIAEVPF
jgi:hypothetical protein